MYACMHVCMYVYTYIHIHIYIYIYTHTTSSIFRTYLGQVSRRGDQGRGQPAKPTNSGLTHIKCFIICISLCYACIYIYIYIYTCIHIYTYAYMQYIVLS